MAYNVYPEILVDPHTALGFDGSHYRALKVDSAGRLCTKEEITIINSSRYRIYDVNNIAPGDWVTVWDFYSYNPGVVNFIILRIYGGDYASTIDGNWEVTIDGNVYSLSLLRRFFGYAELNPNAGGPIATCLKADTANYDFYYQRVVAHYFKNSIKYRYRNLSSTKQTIYLGVIIEYTLFGV